MPRTCSSSSCRARYERGSMLITSNRSVGEWGSVLGDPVVATAILDQLLHHSHVITIRGDSIGRARNAAPGSSRRVGQEPSTGVALAQMGPQSPPTLRSA